METQMKFPIESQPEGEKASRVWGWAIGIGITLALFGCFVAGHVAFATLVSMMILGYIVVVSGVVETINAFFMREWSGFFLELLSGVIAVFFGILILRDPVMASSALTFLIALYLMAEGLVKTIGSALIEFPGRGALFLSGILNFVLGTFVLSGWPGSSLWVLGLFLAVRLLIAGGSMIGLGVTLHRIGKRPELKAV